MSDYEHRHRGETALIIGSGPSAQQLVDNPALGSHFNRIIAINRAITLPLKHSYLFILDDCHDRPWWPKVLPTGCQAIIPDFLGPLLPQPQTHYWFAHTSGNLPDYFLPFYSQWRGARPMLLVHGTTLTPALHFCYICDFKHVYLIGCEMSHSGPDKRYAPGLSGIDNVVNTSNYEGHAVVNHLIAQMGNVTDLSDGGTLKAPRKKLVDMINNS